VGIPEPCPNSGSRSKFLVALYILDRGELRLPFRRFGLEGEKNMDNTTLLIVVIVLIVLLGGGGWYGRGRWF
jgi:hypothetical protein